MPNPITVNIISPQLYEGDEIEPVKLHLFDDGTYRLGQHRQFDYPTSIGVALPERVDHHALQPANVTLRANGTYALERISRSQMTQEHLQNELAERYGKFRDTGWWLRPSSYQIRNADMTPGGWVAQVQIYHETYDKLTVQPLMERDPKVYASLASANGVAVQIGVAWLENNVGAGD